VHSPGADGGGVDLGMDHGGWEGGGSNEYVYDYYWIDPDAAVAGRGVAEGGKVANVEVDLDEL